jgi:hypothetical protein
LRLITPFITNMEMYAMKLARIWQILLPVIVMTGVASAQSEAEIAATIDSEIQSLERQVEDLHTQFTASLKSEESIIEKFLDPNSDPKSVEEELEQVRERSTKLSEHLEDAEGRLGDLRKGRDARIREKMKIAKSREDEEAKQARERVERQAREAAAKETELARQRETQQQAVRLAAERAKQDAAAKAGREADAKIRAVQMLEEARERTRKAAEARRERLAKQREKAERARLKLEEEARARGIDPSAEVKPGEDAVGSAERLRREAATQGRIQAVEMAKRRAEADREALRQQELQEEAARRQREAERAQARQDRKGFFGRWFGGDDEPEQPDSSAPPAPQN